MKLGITLLALVLAASLSSGPVAGARTPKHGAVFPDNDFSGRHLLANNKPCPPGFTKVSNPPPGQNASATNNQAGYGCVFAGAVSSCSSTSGGCSSTSSASAVSYGPAPPPPTAANTTKPASGR